MVIWSILRPFGLFCGHLVYFVAIWSIFSRFGMLFKEKSGNPEPDASRGHFSDCNKIVVYVSTENSPLSKLSSRVP
jgi:hypothetical protein